MNNGIDNRTDTSAVKNIEHVDGRLILQGAENGRGWTLVILKENGKMSSTVSDEDVGFVVFGACTKNESCHSVAVESADGNNTTQ